MSEKNYKSGAFSVLELMLTLVIISCVIAAFMPLIMRKGPEGGAFFGEVTRNRKVESLFLSYDSAITSPPGDYFTCEKVSGANQARCRITIPASRVNAVFVGGGGGGAAAVSGDPGEQTKVYYNPDAGEKTIDITAGMSDIRITVQGAGGGGGGSVYYARGDEPCPGKSIESVSGDKKYCITTVNVRSGNVDNSSETAGEEIVSASDLVSSGKCFSSGKNGTCSTSDNGYSSCNRTVCSYLAAEKLCAELFANNPDYRIDGVAGWRLPTLTEAAAGGAFGQKRSELNFCAQSAFGNFVKCSSKSSLNVTWWSGVPTSYNGNRNVNPDHIWVDRDSNLYYPYYYPQNPSWLNGKVTKAGQGNNETITSNNVTNYYTAGITDLKSVRCVMEKTGSAGQTLYYVYSGGGGAAGEYKTVTVPSATITKCVAEDLGCKLKIMVGKGGAGGLGGVYGDARNAAAGSITNVQVIDARGRILHNYIAQGGAAGGGATTHAVGKSGGGLAKQGNQGSSDDNKSWKSETGVTGGEPDPSLYSINPSSLIKDENDKSATIDSGSGGRGGGIPAGGAQSAEEVAGEQGHNGLVIITYKSFLKGSSGGGGGGGAMVRKKDIANTSGTFEVLIGGGGSGGSAGKEAGMGTSGADTVLNFGVGEVYIAGGGQRGSIGYREGQTLRNGQLVNDSSVGRTFGMGGQGGQFSPRNLATVNRKGETKDGQDGTTGNAQKYDEESDTDTGINAVGGNGGKSGIFMSFTNEAVRIACGGLRLDSTISCANQNNVDAFGSDYVSNAAGVGAIHDYGSYGSYGAGGGGGGWMYDGVNESLGSGGSGQGGYVYLWWTPAN